MFSAAFGLLVISLGYGLGLMDNLGEDAGKCRHAVSGRCSLPSSSSRAPCHHHFQMLPESWSTSAPFLLAELWLPAFSELGNQITKLAEIVSDKPV